jgi:hypothetical protein
VAVILKNKPSDALKVETEFFRLRRAVDLRIEPVLVDDEIDPSGFCHDISRYGRVVFNAG